MSRVDTFAAHIVAGMMASGRISTMNADMSSIARTAYVLARAMEREAINGTRGSEQ